MEVGGREDAGRGDVEERILWCVVARHLEDGVGEGSK